MSEDTQQGLTRVLEQDGKLLENLLKKIKEFKALKVIIDAYLEPKLASKCSLASFDDGHLAITTESAIWATQFRFQIPILQAKLVARPEFKSLRQISCKVRPPVSKPHIILEASPAPLLTPETARIIEDAAKSISYDKLREVMEKIATHIEKD